MCFHTASLAQCFPIPSDLVVQVGVANRIGVADGSSDGSADDRSNRLPHAAADRAADAAADHRAERGAHPRDRRTGTCAKGRPW